MSRAAASAQKKLEAGLLSEKEYDQVDSIRAYPLRV
jgi:hypothetical protein